MILFAICKLGTYDSISLEPEGDRWAWKRRTGPPQRLIRTTLSSQTLAESERGPHFYDEFQEYQEGAAV